MENEESTKQKEETVAGYSSHDHPTDDDTLGFEPYVKAVSEFLTAEATRAPFTISIEGEWGSGKTSFMKQLKTSLKKKNTAQSSSIPGDMRRKKPCGRHSHLHVLKISKSTTATAITSRLIFA